MQEEKEEISLVSLSSQCSQCSLYVGLNAGRVRGQYQKGRRRKMEDKYRMREGGRGMEALGKEGRAREVDRREAERREMSEKREERGTNRRMSKEKKRNK